MNSLANLVAPGVATGDDVQTLLNAAKAGGFAYPAVNAANTNTINATLEAARKVNSPVIVQLSQGGSAFFCGKSLKLEGLGSSILGAIAAAHYVHNVAQAYGIPVILHTDHAAKKTVALDRRPARCQRDIFRPNRQIAVQFTHD